MKELRSATQLEMAAAFLRSEEAKEASDVPEACETFGIDQKELFQPQNAASLPKVLLWTHGCFLDGFPDLKEVDWRKIELGAVDTPQLRYSGHQDWVDFAGPSRLVSDGVGVCQRGGLPTDTPIAKRIKEKVDAIETGLDGGKTYEPLVAVEGPAQTIILVEGHHRATAYAKRGVSFTIFLGRSPQLGGWRYY